MIHNELQINDEEIDASEGDSNEFVRSLARGLAVIEAFDHQHSALTLSDVAKRTGVSRATARRLLHTLTTLGYVSQRGRLFTLRPKVLRLGLAYLSSFTLTSIARPFMEELVEQVQESCSVSVLDGSEIVYVERVSTKRIMSIDISIGTRLPAVFTSMGRVLLADQSEAVLDQMLAEALAEGAADNASHLQTSRRPSDPVALKAAIFQCRQQGWALVDEELEAGLRSIAVPIRGRDGSIVAAMNMSTNAARVPRDKLLDELLPALQETAEAVSRALKFS